MPFLLQILPDIRAKKPEEEGPRLKLLDSGIKLAARNESAGGEDAAPVIRRKSA